MQSMVGRFGVNTDWFGLQIAIVNVGPELREILVIVNVVEVGNVSKLNSGLVAYDVG